MIKYIILLLSLEPTLAFANSIPKLNFEYGIFDMYCHPDEEKPITSEMQKELTDRIPQFQRLWNSQGEENLRATVNLFKLNFNRKEEVATLILCPWFPPMSSPLMIRMRDFLKSSTKDPKPEFYFVALTFHELLHQYLDSNFDQFLTERKSPLFKKYAKEVDGVLVHMHLLAILKSVYLSQKKQNELQKIIEWDSKIPGPVYKRSWEIVNLEGYEKLINELMASKREYTH